METRVNKVLQERFLKQVEYGGTKKVVNEIEPLVSVSVPTYQHGKYIRECLESIVNQETDFLYEVIVGEDGSKDETRDICIEFADRYPDKIRLFLRDRELSQYYEDGKFITRFNGIWNRMSARGKYIAMCEGDDYWTDPYKLQKQIDFLEDNPNISLSFHAAKHLHLLTEKEVIHGYKVDNRIKIFKAKDAILGGGEFMTTNSMVFRTEHIKNMPKWILSAPTGDYALAMLLSSYGNIAYLNDIMSVYRKGVSGSWTNDTRNIKYQIKWLLQTNKMLANFNVWSNRKYFIYIIIKQLLNIKNVLLFSIKEILKIYKL